MSLFFIACSIHGHLFGSDDSFASFESLLTKRALEQHIPTLSIIVEEDSEDCVCITSGKTAALTNNSNTPLLVAPSPVYPCPSISDIEREIDPGYESD